LQERFSNERNPAPRVLAVPVMFVQHKKQRCLLDGLKGNLQFEIYVSRYFDATAEEGEGKRQVVSSVAKQRLVLDYYWERVLSGAIVAQSDIIITGIQTVNREWDASLTIFDSSESLWSEILIRGLESTV